LYFAHDFLATTIGIQHLGEKGPKDIGFTEHTTTVKELLTTFSDIPTSIGGLFLTADVTLTSAEPPESSPARQLQALLTTRDDSIPAS